METPVLVTAQSGVSEYLAALQRLGPLIEQQRRHFDERRRIPDQVFAALADAGLFRLYLPKTLGGRPRAYLSNPFPADNPLQLPVGKTLGAYNNVGNSASWADQNYRRSISCPSLRQHPRSLARLVGWWGMAVG